MTREATLVVSYGSLMSCKGLRCNPVLFRGVESAYTVEVPGVRGFAKPTESGEILAMDIDCYGLQGRILDKQKDLPGPIRGLHFQALALEVTRDALMSIANREAYHSMSRILARAGRTDVARYLWDQLLDQNIQPSKAWNEFAGALGKSQLYNSHMILNYDATHKEMIQGYRKRLDELGALSPDYNPHPIQLGKDCYGLLFVAAGRLHPSQCRKKKKEALKVMRLEQAATYYPWLNNNESHDRMVAYCLECLLGELQGVSTADIGRRINLKPVRQGILRALQREVQQEARCLGLLKELSLPRQVVDPQGTLKRIRQSLGVGSDNRTGGAPPLQ